MILMFNTRSHREPSRVLCDDLGGGMGGGRDAQEGDDICVTVTDLCCCTAETNSIVKQFSSN